MPLVTVGIPTYNRSKLVRRAIESVLAQSLTDIEIIVGDNASSDDTGEVVKSFDDPRVQYLRRPENIGHYRNESDLLRSGTAPYVSVLFDDEVMAPTNLERKLAVLQSDPDIAMAHSAFFRMSTDGRVVKDHEEWCSLDRDTVETGEEFIERTFERPCRVHVATTVIRRDVANQVAFREEDKPADDHALWLQIARFGKIAYLNDALASFCVTEGWSSENGYMSIDGVAYRERFDRVVGFREVLERFLVQQQYPPEREAALRHAMDRSWRRQLCQAVRDEEIHSPKPVRSTLEVIGRAARLDPLVLVNSSMPRALAGRAREIVRRERSRAS